MKRQFLQLLARVVINACGLFIAAQIFANLSYQDDFSVLIIASIILAIINAVVRPFVVILALPAYIVTLGLFSILVNALMIYLVDLVYRPFEAGGFITATLAGLIIGLVNYILTRVFDTLGAEKHG